MHTTDQPEETLSEGATPRAPGASAGLSAEEGQDGAEPMALASSLRPVPAPPPPSAHGGSTGEASPFAAIKRNVLPFAERSGATTEAYSVRLPTELKRRLMEAVQREGGPAAALFEQLLEAHESKREEAEGDMAEKFVRTRRNVEGHLRALMVTLTADLRELAAGDDMLEAESVDLVLQLKEAMAAHEATQRTLEARNTQFVEQRHAWEDERKTLQDAQAAAAAEIRDLKEALKIVHMSLSETQGRLAEVATLKERLLRAETKAAEEAQRAGRADLAREEAELKLARASEDLTRERRALAENENLRVRQHQMAEEERKALESRAAAENERLEAMVERLQFRLAEMTKSY
jgi:hypothetical protein